jgi:Zn-dependent protease with chaperone function
MFNNVIYLIVVLLVYNTAPAEGRVEQPAALAFLLHLLGWVAFALFCRTASRRTVERAARGRSGLWAGAYQRLVMQLSILAVVLFTLDVHLLHLRHWLQLVPGAGLLSVIPGAAALALFFFYLATVWFFASSAYARAHGTPENRGGFITGNLRLNAPIVFPWIALTFLFDLIALTPWAGPGTFLDRTEGQMLLIAAFLLILMTFMPRLIQTWWGCSPFPGTEKVLELKRFLADQGFRYRGILRWPLFEGRMITAGIMGIVPRYRYILVTDGLMDLLSVEELKAVMAHEMGHARYRHLLFYVLFFLGFMVISFGLFDLLYYLLASRPVFIEALESGSTAALRLFYLSLSVPVLLAMLLYFRFLMGFFMRHFERQADLFAAHTMGRPDPVIRSLERIALAGGKIRDLPSWHHFSIRERVECLERSASEPGLLKRQNRFVGLSFAVYLSAIVGFGWLLNFSDVKEEMAYRFLGETLSRQLEESPDNALLHRNLAMIHHQLGEHRKAVSAYETALSIAPDSPTALNNLAWILLTAPEKDLRDPQRALALARRAVSLQRTAPFLDTLAEAYHQTGDPRSAVRVIEAAIAVAGDREAYYEEQRRKFMRSIPSAPP